jgi:putative Holliday junction resolvase
MTRVIALDHGEARCGVAISDPTGELVTPLPMIDRPDSRRGLGRVASVVREREAELVVVGLPLTLAGEEGAQAEAARAFAQRLAEAVAVPVELHDERLTTRMADRTGGSADPDSVAAAHLLESWLQARRGSEAERRMSAGSEERG